MNHAIATTILVLVTAAATLAQEATDAEKTARHRRGRKEVWIGVGLAAAGAVTFPLSELDRSNDFNSSKKVGFALVSGGLGLIWWGFEEQRRASKPQIRFGASIGRTTAVHVRRTW